MLWSKYALQFFRVQHQDDKACMYGLTLRQLIAGSEDPSKALAKYFAPLLCGAGQHDAFTFALECSSDAVAVEAQSTLRTGEAALSQMSRKLLGQSFLFMSVLDATPARLDTSAAGTLQLDSSALLVCFHEAVAVTRCHGIVVAAEGERGTASAQHTLLASSLSRQHWQGLWKLEVAAGLVSVFRGVALPDELAAASRSVLSDLVRAGTAPGSGQVYQLASSSDNADLKVAALRYFQARGLVTAVSDDGGLTSGSSLSTGAPT
jgi:hypothetical protein